MRRRQYLRSVAGVSGAAAGFAGCLGTGRSDTTLGEPDRQVESEDLQYPAWGQRVPDVTLPDPLDGGEVAVRDVETPSLLTFFYSHCRTMCPVLISALRNVQTHATNEGYADEVAFLPVTFDPARDDADRLRSYADRMNVDATAGNWRFLRPEGEQRAEAVVTEEFGVAFERTPAKDGDGYMFTHLGLILLVNADGYVERAYRGDSPDSQTIIDHLQRLR
ncbi:SCO family protein [Halostella salina]|uniref:SCO family protein n=1 Tax=Halostella salina TaxID=1547897 RepID=UPI000EF83C11|nr:SCO family protein [Halostella salina]